MFLVDTTVVRFVSVLCGFCRKIVFKTRQTLMDESGCHNLVVVITQLSSCPAVVVGCHQSLQVIVVTSHVLQSLLMSLNCYAIASMHYLGAVAVHVIVIEADFARPACKQSDEFLSSLYFFYKCSEVIFIHTVHVGAHRCVVLLCSDCFLCLVELMIS